MEDSTENTLRKLANDSGPLYAPTGRLKKTAGLTRAQVIEAFKDSFELIGGVPRLAVWADSNPGDFFKLFGRLLPASSTAELDGPQEIIVRHALPAPGTMNGHQDNRAQISPARNLQELSRTEPEVGDQRSASAGRQDGSDNK